MPKFLSHWIFAEEARRRMPADTRVRRAVDRSPNLYRVGAVAPDTPFYLFFGPGSAPLQRRAEGFHEKGGGIERFLIAPGEPAADPGTAEKRLAFAAGILCHAAADAAFHPMVYYLSGAGTPAARIRHHRLEGYIDLFFSEGLRRPAEKRLGRILGNLEVDTATLVEWMAELFHLHGHRRRLFLSIRLNVLLQAMFLNRPGRVAAASLTPYAPASFRAYLAHFYPPRAPAAGRLFPDPVFYRNPATGTRRQVRLEQMGKEAVDTALVMLENVERGERRADSLMPAGWNLHTGAGEAPKEAMRVFDTQTPLEAIVGLDRI